jgi:diadenosine tetraphosphate (Ap4A) HIT family hydrolase
MLELFDGLYAPGCRTCEANSGQNRINPGPTIFEGDYWLVEHAYPVAIKGWLVIATKRHIIAPHELTTQEFMEYSGILQRSSELLHQELNSEKEYNMFFGEGGGFNHLHYHLVAKTPNWSENYSGAKVFGLLKTPIPLPREEIAAFSEYLKSKY